MNLKSLLIISIFTLFLFGCNQNPELNTELKTEPEIDYRDLFGDLIFTQLSMNCGGVMFQEICIDFAKCSTLATLDTIPVSDYPVFIDSYKNNTNTEFWVEYLELNPAIQSAIDSEVSMCQEMANKVMN